MRLQHRRRPNVFFATLAQKLGLAVIAEGAETLSEVDCLREVGCEFNQGYAFSEALPAGQITPPVRKQLGAHLSLVGAPTCP